NSASFTRGRPAARCTLRCDGVPPAATRSGRRRCPAAGRRRCPRPQSGWHARRRRWRGRGNRWSGAVFWRRRGGRRRRHGRAVAVAPGFIGLAPSPSIRAFTPVFDGLWGRAAPQAPGGATLRCRVIPTRPLAALASTLPEDGEGFPAYRRTGFCFVFFAALA